MKAKIAISLLKKETKLKLMSGMEKSEAGRAKLRAYAEFRTLYPRFFTAGASFMLSKREYDQFMKDADNE